MRPIALGVVVLAAACGPGSYRDFRDQLIDSACDWGTRCGAVAKGDRAHCPTEPLLHIFHDGAADHAIAGAIDIAASIDAGRMRYDSVNAQSCLDAVSGAPCEPTLAERRIAHACNAVVQPHTETDRPCWADSECTGGVCARSPDCAGVCAAYASITEPCAPNAAAAMTCDPTVAFCGPLTADGPTVCQSKKPVDSTCDDTRECDFDYTCRMGTCTNPVELDENAACGGTDPCDDDHYCDPTTAVCTKRQKLAAPCTSRYACEDDLGCIGLTLDAMGGFVSPGTCTAWLAPGAECTQPQPDGVSGCPDSAPCTGGACTAPPPAAARGDNCTSTPCADGLACDGTKRCDFVEQIFGDCGGTRAALCDPALTCVKSGSDGSCLPPDAQACFLPSES
jgi:hypothetical protein